MEEKIIDFYIVKSKNILKKNLYLYCICQIDI